MYDRIHYTSCPVCSSSRIKDVFNVKDYTVSGESFLILECLDCSLRFTQDVPAPDRIAAYYKSENYISHTNTSKGLVNSLYQLVRKRTLHQKRKLAEGLVTKQQRELLDIGSGTGAFVNEMQLHGWKVTGLEPDAGARKVAADLYHISLQAPEKLFDLTEKRFDIISLWHVLEHVHELKKYISQCHRLLAENGRLLIAVPNYLSLDARVYGEYWAAYDVPRHLYHFTPAAMNRLLSANGFVLQAYRPMWFDSFYISMLSSRYKTGHTNLPGAFWTGLRSNARALRNVRLCSSVIYIAGK
ncbi:MAG TPA: class I SAM-dependent methyltransferase [Chitinophagaceae bacterium]|nr:class I SAM-dependent methyltransferase [Chitinophagaceae bacterium]